MEKRKCFKKIAVFLLITSLMVCNFRNFYHAEALPVADLFLDEMIVNILSASGNAITNVEWLTALHDAYGSISIEYAIEQGWLALNQAGSYIDNGLSTIIMNAPEYAELGLNDLFSGSSVEVTSGVAASGGAILAGQFGASAFTGTVLPVVGAVGAGISLGVIANHFINKFGKFMINGSYLTVPESIVNYTGNEGQLIEYIYAGTSDPVYLGMQKPLFVYSYPNLDYYIVGLYNDLNSIVNFRTLYVPMYGSNNQQDFLLAGKSSRNATRGSAHPVGKFFNNSSEATEYINKIKNGEIELDFDIYSPDVISENGNSKGTYTDGQGYDFPENVPQASGDNVIVPMNWQDYLNWVNQANQNTTDGLPDDNKDLFEDLIEIIIPGSVPDPDPVPDPVPDPEVDPDPAPDYEPVIPDQPQYPDKEEVSSEDIGEAGPYTTPNLKDKFPFCIPWDIKRIFTHLNSGRAAPRINWHWYIEGLIDYTFDIDFSIFNDVAQLLRTLELILFVMVLAVNTRKLIGA